MYFSSNMRKVIGWLLAYNALITLLLPNEEYEKFSDLNNLLAFLLGTILTIFQVWFLHRLHSHNGTLVLDQPYKELRVWGYLWRVFLSLFLGYVPTILLLLIIMRTWTIPIPSIEYTIIFLIILFLSTVVVMWLMYSRDRKRQAREIMHKVAGY